MYSGPDLVVVNEQVVAHGGPGAAEHRLPGGRAEPAAQRAAPQQLHSGRQVGGEALVVVRFDEEAGAAAVSAYGPNLARLRKLKKQYDPENVFHLNVNIPPA